LLQTDPQSGLALAQPLARESAFYAMARHGALCAGLDAVDRLATAGVLAIEDAGILTRGRWRIDAVSPLGALRKSDAQALVLRGLSAVLGHPAGAGEPELLVDEAVERLVEHGAVVQAEGGLLHLAGLSLARRTHGASVDARDAPPLVRHLLLVGPDGAPRALVRLTTQWRPDLAQRLAGLRAAGISRLALLPRAADHVAAAAAPGFDDVLPASREAQRAWLEAQAARGEQIAVLHGGLREIVPAGGVSLCPVHGESGADVTLVADPLRGTAAALQLARELRRRLRGAASTTVAVHSALMALSGLRALPPALVALTHQAWNVYLLLAARGLARAEPPPTTMPDDEDQDHGHQGPDPAAFAAARTRRGGGGGVRGRALRGTQS
jgi:cation transport ATPase